MMNDYEVSQKILIFLIGVSAGAGRYIPWSANFPVSYGEFVEVPVAELWGNPLVLVVLVFFYITAEAMEPSGMVELGGQESEDLRTNDEEDGNDG